MQGHLVGEQLIGIYTDDDQFGVVLNASIQDYLGDQAHEKSLAQFMIDWDKASMMG